MLLRASLQPATPRPRRRRRANRIADEVGAEIRAAEEKEKEKLKKELEEHQAREARIAEKIGASGAALATLSRTTDDMARVIWYKAKGDNMVLGSWIRFYFGINTREGKPVLMPLRLKVHLEDSDWVFARKAIFKVDGKVYEVKGDDWQHNNYGGTVWESADVPLSKDNPELMRALVSAKEVKVRFEGRERIRDRSISAKQIAMLKEVLDVWQEINAAGDAK